MSLPAPVQLEALKLPPPQYLLSCFFFRNLDFEHAPGFAWICQKLPKFGNRREGVDWGTAAASVSSLTARGSCRAAPAWVSRRRCCGGPQRLRPLATRGPRPEGLQRVCFEKTRQSRFPSQLSPTSENRRRAVLIVAMILVLVISSQQLT